MPKRTVTVKADPNDDKHVTKLEVEAPSAPSPEKPKRAEEYLTAVHPDLGIEAVFAPGDALPDWYTTAPEE